MIEEYRNALRSSEAFSSAEAKDLAVLLPGPGQLFIDLDTEAAYQEYKKFRDYFFKLVPVSYRELIYTSRNGVPGRHVVITFSESITAWQRIALQAVLGSDPKREYLSAIRLMLNDPHPTLFMETKEQAAQIERN